MADISAAKTLFSTHLMPPKTPGGPVIQPRFSEGAGLRLARRNRALDQFFEGQRGQLHVPACCTLLFQNVICHRFVLLTAGYDYAAVRSGHTQGITSVRAETERPSGGHSARTFTRCYLGIYNAVKPYSDRGMCKVYPVADVPWSNMTDRKSVV